MSIIVAWRTNHRRSRAIRRHLHERAQGVHDDRDLYRFALLEMIGVAGANFTYYFTIKESTVATAILIQYTAPILVLTYDVHVLKITPIGVVTGIGSVLSFAFLNVSMRHLVGRYSVWTVILYSLAFASIMWMVINPPWNIVARLPESGMWGILAGFAAIITSTFEPIVAIVSATLFLGEYVQPVQVMGAVLVILALVALQVRRESPRSDGVRAVAVERTNAT